MHDLYIAEIYRLGATFLSKTVYMGLIQVPENATHNKIKLDYYLKYTKFGEQIA